MDNKDKNESFLKLNRTPEELERRIYDLENLIGLGISLSSNLQFESLVESILYSCIGQMFVEKVAILLQEDLDVNNFYIHMAKGYDEEFDDTGIILKSGSRLQLYFSQNPEPVEIDKRKILAEYENELSALSFLQPKLIVPMKSKDSLNGFILLGDKISGDLFSITDKMFMRDLAKFAAIAVENSRLYLMATLDRMTRLYTHHYFNERLAEEMMRSKRYGTPLSLIMADIDHFKKINDTYGHQQGDVILKGIARIFRENIRSVDIPARYGGEEFSVILPGSDLDDACSISERLRKAIENTEFQGEHNPIRITISIGIAEYKMESDTDISLLISRTDRALYNAKHNGRNRVSVGEGTFTA